MPSCANYVLGVLIIVLIAFFCICKCDTIGGMYKSVYKSENMKSGMTYGGDKIVIVNSRVNPYIKYNNGVIEVPNSKSAMRNLMSTE